MSKTQKLSLHQTMILERARAAGFTGITARGLTDLALAGDDYNPIRENRVMATVSRCLRRLTRRAQLVMIVRKGKRTFYDAALYSMEQVAKRAAAAAVAAIRKGAQPG